MRAEMVIKKLSDKSATVKISHSQTISHKMNLVTGNSSSRRIDHYHLINEGAGKQSEVAIPKYLYSALRKFEIDPKFK